MASLRKTLLRTGPILCSILCGSCNSDYLVLSPSRDFHTDPAVVEHDAPQHLYAVSDVHGGYARFVTLLAAAHLIEGAPSTPNAIRWTGRTAMLVIVGDLIDKGPQGLEVIDAVMSLEASAAPQGGTVITLLGNHEAEFFADPHNSKADSSDGVDHELDAVGIDPISVASGADPRGAWLRRRPIAARVGTWLFTHGGNTGGRSLAEMETYYESALADPYYRSDALIGDDSILESHDWFTSDEGIGARYATAAGATHLVFGHSPKSLGASGAIAVGQGGSLFRIDCGMSPGVDYSEGRLLHVHHESTGDDADSIGADGVSQALWMGP